MANPILAATFNGCRERIDSIRRALFAVELSSNDESMRAALQRISSDLKQSSDELAALEKKVSK